jgi:hypothetical protein
MDPHMVEGGFAALVIVGLMKLLERTIGRTSNGSIGKRLDNVEAELVRLRNYLDRIAHDVHVLVGRTGIGG